MSSTASRSSMQVSKQKHEIENHNIMEDKNKDLYTNAHLFVAAIRVCEHQNNTPPNVEDICRILSMSIEHSSYICRKLKQMGIIEVVEGSFGDRLFVRDFLKMRASWKRSLKNFENPKKVFPKKLSPFKPSRRKKRKIFLLKWRKN